MSPHSAFQRKNSERGFTLLEVLVVLAVVALVGAALFGFQPRQSGALAAEAFVRSLRDEFRRARASAIFDGDDVVVVFDREARWFEHRGARLPIPEDLIAEVMAADVERQGPARIGIRFLPTGKSTGGVVRVLRAKDAALVSTLTVNWLTGEVTLASGRGT